MKCERCGGRMYVDRDMGLGATTDDWACIQCGHRVAAREKVRAMTSNGNGRSTHPAITPAPIVGTAPSEAVRASTVDAARFAQTMTQLMEDVIAGKVTPQVANAACNAGSQLLKLLQLHYRYGALPPQGEP